MHISYLCPARGNATFGPVPEHFQWRMHSLMEGLPGVLCVMDDILIFGTARQEHNSQLQAVLKRLSSAGITLNSRKCEF